MLNIVKAIAVLAICGYGISAWAGECHDGDARYRAALRSDNRVVALESLTRSCPTHVKALNDLALAYEEDERFSAAAKYYRLAIQAEPDFPLPYAGLGDVLVAEGSLRLAVNAYKGFLRLLAEQDSAKYARYAQIYRKRLAVLMERLSTSGIVTASSISSSLSRSYVPSTSRGLRVVPIRAEIDLAIHFAFASAKLLNDTEDQLDQLATALRGHNLRDVSIVIEGHTDSIGSDHANMVLSQSRADSVREALIVRGIDGGRIRAVGKGENFPVAENSSESGQRLNRRVTFINTGSL
jgi:outer membrane protein OmpA-like peptidoglycan-associated protein